MAKEKKKVEQNIREKLAESEAEVILDEENLDSDVKGAAKTTSDAPVSSDKAVMKLQANVEKILAELEIFKQFRNINEEKFHQMSEEIGELRSTLLEKEKSIGEFEAKTAKVYDMVEAVQPDQLMKNVQKLEAQIETAGAARQKDEKVIEGLTAELRSIQDAVAVFKNTERLVKLNADIGRQLSNIEKTQSKIEREGSKVEDMFIEMGKKTGKYDLLFEKVDSLEVAFKDMLKGFDEVEIGYKDLVKQKDFEKFQKDMGNLVDTEKKEFLRLKGDIQLQLESATQFLNALEEKEEGFDKQSYLLLDDARGILKRATERQEGYDSVLTRIDDFENKLVDFSKTITSKESASSTGLDDLKRQVDGVDGILRAEISRTREESANALKEKFSAIQKRLDEENTDMRTQLTQHMEDLKTIKNTLMDVTEGDSSLGTLHEQLITVQGKLKAVGELKKMVDEQGDVVKNVRLGAIPKIEGFELQLADLQKLIAGLEERDKGESLAEKNLGERIDGLDKKLMDYDAVLTTLEGARQTIEKYDREFKEAEMGPKKLSTLLRALSEKDKEARERLSELQKSLKGSDDKFGRLDRLLEELKLHGQKVIGVEEKSAEIEAYHRDVLRKLSEQSEHLRRLDALEGKVSDSEKEMLVFIKDSKDTLVTMEREKGELEKVVQSIVGNKEAVKEFAEKEAELKGRISEIEKKSAEVLTNMAKANKNIYEREGKWDSVLEENRKLIEELRQERDRVKTVSDGLRDTIANETQRAVSEIAKQSSDLARTIVTEVDGKHQEFANTIAEVQKKLDESSRQRRELLVGELESKIEEAEEKLDILASKHTGEQKKVLEQTREMVEKLIQAEKVLQEKRADLNRELEEESKKYKRLEGSMNNLLTVVNNLVSHPTHASLPTHKCENCSKNSKVFWLCAKCGKKVCEDCSRSYKSEVYCTHCLNEAAKILQFRNKAEL